MWHLGGPWALGPPAAPQGLARLSKQLPLDAGAAVVAGRWLGVWPPGAGHPWDLVGNVLAWLGL